MTHFFRQGAIAISAAVLTQTSPALADIAPQDVWTQWKSYMDSFGYELENDPVVEGSDLRLPNFSMAVPVPADPSTGDEGGIVRLNMGDVALVDRGDGTVSIEIAPVTPLSVIGESLGERNFKVDGTMTTKGYSTIASGDPGDITYRVQAIEMDLVVDSLTSGEDETVTPGTVSLSLQGTSGTSRINTSEGPTQLDQDIRVDQLGFTFDISDLEDSSGSLNMVGELTDLVTTANGVIPAQFDPLEVPQALAEGYAMSAAFSYGAGRTSFDFAEDDQAMRYNSSSKGGTFNVGLSSDGLIYEVAVRDAEIALEGSDIPFPIATSLSAAEFNFAVPILKGDELQDFTATLALTDVEVPAPVWMMIDPAGTLPHDPLTAELRTSGKALLFVDVFDEEATSRIAVTGERPAELTRLSLDSLLLKAGGATIAAAGGFDVDNTMKNAMNPKLPAIEGQIDLRLTGVTTLLGTLSQMGLIPAPQAMMASGMIQQLGKPTSAPDDFEALIEVDKASKISINGAPLPF